MTLEYDRNLNRNVVSDHTDQSILEIYYDESGSVFYPICKFAKFLSNNSLCFILGRVTKFQPISSQIIAPMNASYDKFGRLISQQGGALVENIDFDDHGRLIRWKSINNRLEKSIRIVYNNQETSLVHIDI